LVKLALLLSLDFESLFAVLVLVEVDEDEVEEGMIVLLLLLPGRGGSGLLLLLAILLALAGLEEYPDVGGEEVKAAVLPEGAQCVVE